MRATATTLVVLILLAVGYVLSYAPVYRWQEWNIPHDITEPESIYIPVMWLIDETPIRKPLLKWASYWGVRGNLEWDSGWRCNAPPPPATHY